MNRYDVIVIGGGHAGCESALASARMGCATLLVTLSLDNIALMPCNPAIGGIGKGHIVREIDALGGEMARVTDRTGIQFRILNASKGPAVQGSRAQADKHLYKTDMQRVLLSQPGLTLACEEVDELIVHGGAVAGVRTAQGSEYRSACVVVTTGTFLRGKTYVGFKTQEAGRVGEKPSAKLSQSFLDLGFEVRRLKTGTPPRLRRESIDFSVCERQDGDADPKPFSFATARLDRPQVPCHITHTTERTAEVIRRNLDKSPLYSGLIEGVGPRYCPSIEDKIVKFPDKLSHHVFLEPEGLDTDWIYPNGISTSMAEEVQWEIVRSIPGLERAEIVRPGYAVEYDFVPPTQLSASLETKAVRGLFHAGQINGTSGYEEAAAQGLIAGINAARRVRGETPVVLSRMEGYIGVLIDDLVTKGTQEPYRMFTSRAEYRLLLRQDNADRRLMHIGHELGLISRELMERCRAKYEMAEREIRRLTSTAVLPHREHMERLSRLGITELRAPTTLSGILRRPEIRYRALTEAFSAGEAPVLPEPAAEQVEIQIKYEGFIARQNLLVEKQKKLETLRVPEGFVYTGIPGLSREVVQKLEQIRPATLGQAARISGVTPSAIAILHVCLEARRPVSANRTVS